MEQQQRTIISDIDIPFIRLVAIMIKFALAALPAMIVVYIVMASIMLLLAGIFGEFNSGMH